MKRLGRLAFLMMIVGLVMPGFGGTVSAQDHICDRALAAGAGAVVDGYTVVWYTGGSGSQIVLGDGGSYLSGGSGHDVICAWGGGNTLDGGAGHDQLFVMDGTGNALYGGSGNDTLIGYASDVFNGGSGTNVIETMPDPVMGAVYLRTAVWHDDHCDTTQRFEGFPPVIVDFETVWDGVSQGILISTMGPDGVLATSIPENVVFSVTATYTNPATGLQVTVNSPVLFTCTPDLVPM